MSVTIAVSDLGPYNSTTWMDFAAVLKIVSNSATVTPASSAFAEVGKPIIPIPMPPRVATPMDAPAFDKNDLLCAVIDKLVAVEVETWEGTTKADTESDPKDRIIDWKSFISL